MANLNLSAFYDAFDSIVHLSKRLKSKNLPLLVSIFVFVLVSFATISLFHLPKQLYSLEGSYSKQGTDTVAAILPTSDSTHPIPKLISSAREEFQRTLLAQSKTLRQAALEYERRYRIHPPPFFDRWYEFVTENNLQLVDEFDQISEFLLPFWALAPKAIRKRTKEALGSDDFLMGVVIRNGSVVTVERGGEWQQEAITGMLQKFVHYLPDMDIAFNLHDESRVILPHEDLARMSEKARTVYMPRALAFKSPGNQWSTKPLDLSNKNIEPFGITPFNEYAHQFTWTTSRLSCPENTPARTLTYDDELVPDNVTAYAIGELGFIYNKTAFTDVCLSPSLQDSFGFFNRPNAFSVVHDLIPIFSPSKISSFQDILYPSPWYWADKVSRNATLDPSWDEKTDKMYWRGTTTSGYSQDGTWHRQHRQRLLEQLNKPKVAKVMEYRTDYGNSQAGWHVKEVRQQDYEDLFDVHFTFIGQCSPEDCDVQRDYFDMYEDEDYQLAWRNKYLLDVDGNAFSGRFHTFLQSRSLTFKLALFREWHDDWLKQWAHYIPWSVRGGEHLETVRYFANEEEGKSQAQQIAADSSEWAGKVTRHVDMEAWFFRLLLE